MLEDLAITHTWSIDGAGLVQFPRQLRRLESLDFNLHADHGRIAGAP